jgi:hypothetical protein
VFLGLEINPRAAAIAELVLWIGYLQWHFRTKGAAPEEPILRAFKNIQVKNAVLTWDGDPVPKIVDGMETYPNARRPEWPAAEFIVGNPPFIGASSIRSRLGDEFAKALWEAHSHVNESADFVMYWWDRAAELLTRKGTTLRRFGLVTTNSITQEFSRRVVSRHLKAKKPISLVMAIPDHPWIKTSGAAAVRIAMTVAELGARDGVLRKTLTENNLDTDEPSITFLEAAGHINSNLTIGSDVTAATMLRANEGICHDGVKLHGSGFIVTPEEAEHLGLGKRAGLEAHIVKYRNGRDLTARPRGVLVIDLFGLDITIVRQRFPEVYQYLLGAVKPERDVNNRATYRDNWWIFGEPRREMRPALAGITRYIVTVDTARHRVFQFLPLDIICDDKNVVIALRARENAEWSGILSSMLKPQNQRYARLTLTSRQSKRSDRRPKA